MIEGLQAADDAQQGESLAGNAGLGGLGLQAVRAVSGAKNEPAMAGFGVLAGSVQEDIVRDWHVCHSSTLTKLSSEMHLHSAGYASA